MLAVLHIYWPKPNHVFICEFKCCQHQSPSVPATAWDNNRGLLMHGDGSYWTFDRPEEVQKRTAKEASRSKFDFQKLARGNGDGENSVPYDRNDGTETS